MLQGLVQEVRAGLEQHTGGSAGETYSRRETRQIVNALQGLGTGPSTPPVGVDGSPVVTPDMPDADPSVLAGPDEPGSIADDPFEESAFFDEGQDPFDDVAYDPQCQTGPM